MKCRGAQGSVPRLRARWKAPSPPALGPRTRRAGPEGAALPVPGGVGAGPALLRAPLVRAGGSRLSLAQVTEAGRTHELQPAESPHGDPGGPLRAHARPAPRPAPRRTAPRARPAQRPLRGNLGESRKLSGPPGSRPGPASPPRAPRRLARRVNHCSERPQRGAPGARPAARTRRKRRRGRGRAGGGRSRAGGAETGAAPGAGPCWAEAGPQARGRVQGAWPGGRGHERGQGRRLLGRGPLGVPFWVALGPLSSSKGLLCPQETRMGRRTQPQAFALSQPLRPHLQRLVTSFPAQTLFANLHPKLPPPCHPHKGCAHTDPSRPCHVDTDSSQVLLKT